MFDYSVMDHSEYSAMADMAEFAAVAVPAGYPQQEEQDKNKFWKKVAIGSAIAGGTLAGTYALSKGFRGDVNSFVGKVVSLFTPQGKGQGQGQGQGG